MARPHRFWVLEGGRWPFAFRLAGCGVRSCRAAAAGRRGWRGHGRAGPTAPKNGDVVVGALQAHVLVYAGCSHCLALRHRGRRLVGCGRGGLGPRLRWGARGACFSRHEAWGSCRAWISLVRDRHHVGHVDNDDTRRGTGHRVGGRGRRRHRRRGRNRRRGNTQRGHLLGECIDHSTVLLGRLHVRASGRRVAVPALSEGVHRGTALMGGRHVGAGWRRVAVAARSAALAVQYVGHHEVRAARARHGWGARIWEPCWVRGGIQPDGSVVATVVHPRWGLPACRGGPRRGHCGDRADGRLGS